MCLHPPPVDAQRSRPRAQAQIYSDGEQMPKISHACVIAFLSCAAGTAVAASRPHNGKLAQSIPAGDAWLRQNLDGYYQWAKTHNSLLIVTFDENDDQGGYYGLTNPLIGPTRDIRRATTGCYAIFRIGSSQSPPEHISSQAHMPRAKASPT